MSHCAQRPPDHFDRQRRLLHDRPGPTSNCNRRRPRSLREVVLHQRSVRAGVLFVLRLLLRHADNAAVSAVSTASRIAAVAAAVAAVAATVAAPAQLRLLPPAQQWSLGRDDAAVPRHGRPAGNAPVDGRAHCHPTVFGGRRSGERVPGRETRRGNVKRRFVLSVVYGKPRPPARLLRAGHALERLCRDRRRRSNVCAVDGQASESRRVDGSAEHGERAGALRDIQPRRRFARAPGKRRGVAQRRVHGGAPRGLRGCGPAGTTALGAAAVLQPGADDGGAAMAQTMP